MLTVTYAIKSVVVRENHKCFNLSSTVCPEKSELASLGNSAHHSSSEQWFWCSASADFATYVEDKTIRLVQSDASCVIFFLHRLNIFY